MSASKKSTDLIRYMDAVGWLDAMQRCPSGSLDEQGVAMMKDMAGKARSALGEVKGNPGPIMRSDAIAAIQAVLSQPADDLHPKNRDAWFTARCTFVEAMWYPEAVEAEHGV